MKKLFTIALILLVNIAFAQSEKYYVTFVKGQANVKKTNKAVKVGDILLPADALVFKDQTAKVSCISPGKGRFDITAQKTKASPSGELLAVLKNNLVPATSTYHLSTRSLMSEGLDPKIYFYSAETANRILLIKDDVLPIVTSYKRDAANFFFLQYVVNDKTITNKIEQNEKGILFNDALFTVGTEVLKPQKMMLCYQSSGSGGPRSSVLAEFVPVLATKTEIRQQIKLITGFSGTIDEKKLKNEIMAHLFDNYGKIGVEELAALMK